MQLIEPNKNNINYLLAQHDYEGGNAVNASLSKLFGSLNDEQNKYEVLIKVAALNNIYSTAIQYIEPVVTKIVEEIDNNHRQYKLEQYVTLVDKVSTVTWISPTTAKEHTRRNISFCSKYIHFLSGRELPIYDSYIWIVMIAYLNQKNKNKLKFNTPNTYKQFYDLFTKFREDFNLDTYSCYELDKFLWQYGKNLINQITSEQKVTSDQAKTVLKNNLA